MPTYPYDDGQQAALYESYKNDNAFSYITGLVVVPLAADTPSSSSTVILPKIVRLHQPYSLRKQTFAATKQQTPPLMPAPAIKTVDTDDTLLSSSVVIPMPMLNQAAANTFTYTVGGEHLYLGGIPYSTKTGFPTGKWPFASIIAKNMQEPLLNALGGVLGGTVTSFPVLASFVPQYSTGQYYWPFTSVVSAGFFDPTLSSREPVPYLAPPVTVP